MRAKEKKKYVVYFRVSTQRQGQSGLGIDGQKAAVKAFTKARNGKILAEFVEVESGKRDDRPEFQKAVIKVKESGATLLVAKLDRLSRDVHFIAGLRKDGINFTSCDMPDANQFTINVMAAMAEQEREMISELTKTALAVAKEKGVKLGASNPKIKKALIGKGWKNSLGTRKNRANQFAENLRDKIEKLRIEEGRTQQDIVDHFNDYNVPAARGGKWSRSQLKRVMTKLEIE